MTDFVVGNRAIQYIVKDGLYGDRVFCYQGANDATTDAQYALVSAGRSGSDGALNGVVCAGGVEITVALKDNNWQGNTIACAGPIYAGPFGSWSKPANTGPGSFSKSLGTPIASSYTNLLNTTAITALPTEVANGPDVARLLYFTGNAGSASVLSVTGLDNEGTPITENVTLNGTNHVATVHAFGPFPFTIALVTAHNGDTFTVGVSNTLGLPVRLDNRGAVPKGAVTYGGTVEATEPTIAVDASVLSKNLITTNSAPDGSHEIIVNGIRCDAPIDIDIL